MCFLESNCFRPLRLQWKSVRVFMRQVVKKIIVKGLLAVLLPKYLGVVTAEAFNEELFQCFRHYWRLYFEYKRISRLSQDLIDRNQTR